MSEKQSRVQTVEKLFLYFLMAAVIGWCYEVFLEVVVYRWGFDNRGVLFGPYCIRCRNAGISALFRKIRTNADEMEHPLGKTNSDISGVRRCGNCYRIMRQLPAGMDYRQLAVADICRL